MTFSAGYFLWDTYIVLTISPISIPFLLHGVGCFWTFWCSSKQNLQYFGWRMLMFEVSTIFLNSRQWLVIVYKSHWLLKYMDPLFAVSFFLSRLCWGVWVKYNLWSFVIIELFNIIETIEVTNMLTFDE